MNKMHLALLPLLIMILVCSCTVKRNAPAVAEPKDEEAVPDILLGAALPEDHQEIETAACMECHTIITDGVTTATQRFLERPGAIENQELWKDVVAFFGERQSCIIATSVNNEPYVTTVDFALDPVNKVMYAMCEKGTRKLGQIRVNPKVAVEYHQPRDWQSKIFRCLQMRGEARTFGADDALFAEGLRVFKPQVDEDLIRRGMDMICFTPKEILFYDNQRKAKGLNVFQLWKR